jgi:hypothetical protein
MSNTTTDIKLAPAMKGIVGNNPEFSTLTKKDVAFFSFYNFGQRYTVKVYSNKTDNSLAETVATKVQAKNKITLIKPNYIKRDYTNKDGEAKTEHQLVVNAAWQIKF